MHKTTIPSTLNYDTYYIKAQLNYCIGHIALNCNCITYITPHYTTFSFLTPPIRADLSYNAVSLESSYLPLFDLDIMLLGSPDPEPMPPESPFFTYNLPIQLLLCVNIM